MNNIVLFGGGNQLQYSIDVIEKENKFKIVGVVDSIQPLGKTLYGYKIIGRQENIAALINEFSIDGGMITVGDNWTRKYIYDSIVEKVPGFNFISTIHPSAVIGNDVTIGKGVMVMAGCLINPGAKLGDFTFYGTGAQVEHDCEVGEFASISSGSIMGGHVKIGKYAAITLGVILADRLSIGENSVVGSGSLVLKSLPDNVLAYGHPAKIIRSRTAGERFLK